MTIANVEMAKAWDGDEGEDWTEYADLYDASGARHWRRFLDAGLIAETDAVLDIGCGTGQSTRDAARVAAQGSVHGVDLSSQMLEEARRRSAAEDVTNVTFEQADAQVHAFDDGAYDLAISRFGSMFFADAPAAFVNIAGALRPGGRLAMQAWQDLARNPWLNLLRDALAAGRDLPRPPVGAPGPFALSDPEGVKALLVGAGFDDVVLTSVEAPMWLGEDPERAWAFIRTMGVFRGLTEGLDDAAKTAAVAKLRRALDDHATPDGVVADGASWIITARRI